MAVMSERMRCYACDRILPEYNPDPELCRHCLEIAKSCNADIYADLNKQLMELEEEEDE